MGNRPGLTATFATGCNVASAARSPDPVLPQISAPAQFPRQPLRSASWTRRPAPGLLRACPSAHQRLPWRDYGPVSTLSRPGPDPLPPVTSSQPSQSGHRGAEIVGQFGSAFGVTPDMDPPAGHVSG